MQKRSAREDAEVARNIDTPSDPNDSISGDPRLSRISSPHSDPLGEHSLAGLLITGS